MGKKKSLKRNVADKLIKRLKKPSKMKLSVEPLWKGPIEEGVTQSMLQSFLVCRERFRIRNIVGLEPIDEFKQAMEYGNMWHVCEEHTEGDWKAELKKFVVELCKKYPLQQEQVLKWYNVCLIQFPLYLSYWKRNKSFPTVKILSAEDVFSVPYKLKASGRIVLVRGKVDSVVRMAKQGKFLWENKTKGQIDPEAVKNQLSFDLQTMMYFTVLRQEKLYEGMHGVVYNVVRRPLSGGKGSIRKHKPTKKNPKGETDEAFYNRLSSIIEEDLPHFFMRWTVTITDKDVQTFEDTFLQPVLEQLCDWYEYVTSLRFIEGKANTLHYRTPYGLYNVLAQGGTTDLDNYLLTENSVGLEKVDRLFKELD